VHLSHSVLIVVDDDDIRDALLVYMAAFGLNVQVASSAEDALRQISGSRESRGARTFAASQ